MPGGQRVWWRKRGEGIDGEDEMIDGVLRCVGGFGVG